MKFNESNGRIAGTELIIGLNSFSAFTEGRVVDWIHALLAINFFSRIEIENVRRNRLVVIWMSSFWGCKELVFPTEKH